MNAVKLIATFYSALLVWASSNKWTSKAVALPNWRQKKARQRRARAFQFNYFFAPFSIHCAITSINFGFRGSVASKQKHTPGRSEDTRVWYQETVFSGGFITHSAFYPHRGISCVLILKRALYFFCMQSSGTSRGFLEPGKHSDDDDKKLKKDR